MAGQVKDKLDWKKEKAELEQRLGEIDSILASLQCKDREAGCRVVDWQALLKKSATAMSIKQRMRKEEFTTTMERDGEWYIAFCPEIPEANGQGKTKEAARKSLADGIALILKERADSLPQDALFSQNFWESPSLEELAKAQGVKPMKDASDLIGTWPGEVDDGFEEWIDELRHSGRKGSDRS